MERKEAIEILANKQLRELSDSERAEQLDTMTLEDWSSDKEWRKLPFLIKREFKRGVLKFEASSERYDNVLLIWLKSKLQSVFNDYLKKQLELDKINGNPIDLEPCPCCGRKTIGERGNYEICTVCWWEDDGQDNDTADEVFGRPNYGLSLTKARINFLVHGIYDPERKDLFEKRECKEKFISGREFQLVDNKVVIEKGTDWKSEI